jgi:hypothetical protein
MIPAGYLAKRVSVKPDWLEVSPVTDIYSVSGCVSEDFADYVKYWNTGNITDFGCSTRLR